MTSSLKPLQHPAAWVGDELTQRPEWNLVLTVGEVDELLSVASKTEVAFDCRVESDTNPVALPLLTTKAGEIRDRLEEGSGAVRVTGFPAGEVDESTAKKAFWHLCRNIGTPISQSATGVRLFDVRDAGFADTDKRARGPNTRKKLSFHTDRCDVIGFLCYRQAKSGGENLVVSSMSMFNTMLAERPDFVEVLMQPFFYQRHNVDTGNEKTYIEQPVFSIYEGHFASNLLRVLIDRAYAMPDTPEMTDLQREALDFMEQLASRESLHTRFRQEPGDMLFLNNFVTLHRRTEFTDHEEAAQKRHLLRIWLAMPNSRPLHPSFAGNYGATEAGAIRGGMRPSETG